MECFCTREADWQQFTRRGSGKPLSQDPVNQVFLCGIFTTNSWHTGDVNCSSEDLFFSTKLCTVAVPKGLILSFHGSDMHTHTRFLKKSSLERLFFFYKFIYLFIFYFWLCWVFVAARGLSLVAASGGHSSLRCAGFSLQWLLLLWSTGSRCTGFSSYDSRALERRLSSCGARA